MYNVRCIIYKTCSRYLSSYSFLQTDVPTVQVKNFTQTLCTLCETFIFVMHTITKCFIHSYIMIASIVYKWCTVATHLSKVIFLIYIIKWNAPSSTVYLRNIHAINRDSIRTGENASTPTIIEHYCFQPTVV